MNEDKSILNPQLGVALALIVGIILGSASLNLPKWSSISQLFRCDTPVENARRFAVTPLRSGETVVSMAAGTEADGYSRIDVPARNMSDRTGHGHHGKTEGQSDTSKADAGAGEDCRKHGAPAATEDEPERAGKLGRQYLTHWHWQSPLHAEREGACLPSNRFDVGRSRLRLVAIRSSLTHERHLDRLIS
jgi:hypothetical protein